METWASNLIDISFQAQRDTGGNQRQQIVKSVQFDQVRLAKNEVQNEVDETMGGMSIV